MQASASRLRAVILTHYFPPEVGAPQSRLFELATRAAAAGLEVSVVTGFPNYPTGVIPPAYRRHYVAEETLDGLRVIRTWVYATPNRGFLRRLLNHLSFALSSLTALRELGPVDVIFVESPPLFIGLAALVYSWIKRAPFIFNVSDIWPQSAVELGALTNRTSIQMAEWFELLLYRRAGRGRVVTPRLLERLAAPGIPPGQLVPLTTGDGISAVPPRPAT